MASVMDDYDNPQPKGLGPLAAIFSEADALKRRLKDRVMNPLDFLRQVAGQMEDDKTAYRGMTREQQQKADIERGLNWVSGAPGAVAGIIKKQGGNWLKGEVQNATQDLRHLNPPNVWLGGEQAVRGPVVQTETGGQRIEWRDPRTNNLIEAQEGPAGWMEVPEALDTFVNKKLNPYIQNLMATEKDPLRLMADAWPEQKAALLQQAQQRLDEIAQQRAKLVAERGVPPEYLTQLRQREIKAEREKKLVENQNALHSHNQFEADFPDIEVLERAVDNRYRANNAEMTVTDVSYPYPIEGLAKSPEGKRWENTSDQSIGVTPAGEYQALWKRKLSPQLTEIENPWVNKLPENTPTYHIPHDDALINKTGFGHMMDEAYNALDSQSGLPEHLLLTPQQIASMGVPQLSSHVAKIDAWRQVGQHEANYARANNPATRHVREYPTGYSWKQIVPPEGHLTELPPNMEVIESSPGNWKYQLKKENEYGKKQISPPYSSQEEAVQAALSTPQAQNYYIEDALKYEGDHLRHCVGGKNYCNKVANKTGQIFTLRDTNGVPQVTIETTLPRARNANEWYGWQKENTTEYAKLKEEFGDNIEGMLAAATERYPEPTHILQIKGKGNGRPPDEVQDMITNFIQHPPSGQPWGEVDDLYNTDLKKVRGKYMTGPEYEQLLTDTDNRAASLRVRLQKTPEWQEWYTKSDSNDPLIRKEADKLANTPFARNMTVSDLHGILQEPRAYEDVDILGHMDDLENLLKDRGL